MLHSRQSDARCIASYALWRPAAQRVHELCSATVLYWPVGHAVQTEAPPELNLPEGHALQLVEEVLDWNLPLGQVLQVVEPAVVE